jgi:hypothetical protein
VPCAGTSRAGESTYSRERRHEVHCLFDEHASCSQQREEARHAAGKGARGAAGRGNASRGPGAPGRRSPARDRQGAHAGPLLAASGRQRTSLRDRGWLEGLVPRLVAQ